MTAERQQPVSNWLTPAGNPTPKWRGNSLTKLRASLAAASGYESAKAAVTRALNAQIAAEEATSRLEVGKLLDVDPERLRLGNWTCSESPTYHCIYDIVDDQWTDQCLICGEPSERK